METALTVDLYCNWDVDPPAYRLYVDNDLLTERTYVWREQFVREHVVVYLEPGEHTVKIVPVNLKDADKFSYTVQLNGQQVNNQFII